MAPFWARFRYLARNIGSMARPDRGGPRRDEREGLDGLCRVGGATNRNTG